MPLDSLQTLFPMPPPRHNRKRKRRRQKRAVPCSPGLETTAPAPEGPPPPPVDPFTKKYRREAARAHAREAGEGAGEGAFAAHDERPRRAPFVVVKKRACGTARERCIMKPRDEADCGPTRFAVGAYLGHGASGAVFAATVANGVVANDAGEALGPGARVEARYQRGDRWYPGTVQAASGPAGVAVAYDDGDFEDAVARADVRPLAPEVALKVARRAEADELEAEAGLAAAVRARAPPRPAALGTIVEPLATWRWCDAAALAAARLGPTLSDVLRRGGERAGERPPEPVALLLAAGVMEAVLSCHEAGVLHCDVKPDNFLLRAPAAGAAGAAAAGDRDAPAAVEAARRGHGLVLTDFGRGVDRRRHRAGTQFSTALDHAHLAAFEWPPARADRRRAPRPRAPWVHEIDTYAMGVCLHLIATGGLPTRDGRRQGTPPRAWDRDFWTSLIDAHLHTDPDAGAPSFARRREFVAATRAALDARRFEDLDADLRRWCRRAAGK